MHNVDLLQANSKKIPGSIAQSVSFMDFLFYFVLKLVETSKFNRNSLGTHKMESLVLLNSS